MDKSHIDSGNHNILCLGITEIKYVIDHLTLLRLDDAVLMADIYDGAQFILSHRLSLSVRVYAEQQQNAVRQFVYNENNRCQQYHQQIDNRCIGQ